MKKTPKGFTLVEMLIASALFGIIGTLSLALFINMSRSSSTFTLREVMLDDAQFIMNSLVREIADNAIDYEEYFNRAVIKGEFGMNFGQYAAQFYFSEKVSPGQQNHCDDFDYIYPDGEKDSCVNTGKNPPATNKLPGEGSAFFAPNIPTEGLTEDLKVFCKDWNPENELRINKRNYACVQQLYLISPDGKKKIIIAPEKYEVQTAGGNKGNTYVLSRAEMVWPSKDSPGIFTCDSSKCPSDIKNITFTNSGEGKNKKLFGIRSPNPQDLNDVPSTEDDEAADFTPFTPRRVNIRSIKFFLSPVEDPIKTFSEGEDPLIEFSKKEINAKYAIKQPSVTIVLEVEPVENVINGKDAPRITLQKLVVVPILQEVKSYPPRMACFGNKCGDIRKQ